jgi:hypothetical protein
MGDIETWACFWEHFKQSVDNDPSLTTINKHIFLRGYLEEEPKHLVEGIAVVAETYEETKRILEARYGDKNRIIQAHLDYMEDVKPIKYATPEALNSTYVDCNRRIQALRTLGEDINGYGRVLAPKVLHAFLDDICRCWIVHAKREGISEGDILQLMAFLGEEVDRALTTQKSEAKLPAYPATLLQHQCFTYMPSQWGKHRRTRKDRNHFVHFAILAAIGLKIVQRSRTSPIK